MLTDWLRPHPNHSGRETENLPDNAGGFGKSACQWGPDQNHHKNPDKPKERKSKERRKAIRNDYALDRFLFRQSNLPNRDEPFGGNDWD